MSALTNTTEFSDLDVVIIDTSSNTTIKRPCHKYILSKSSHLFKDIISVMNVDDPVMNVYVNDKDEMFKVMDLLSFVYDSKKSICLECIDVILKYQINAAADWLLQNKLSEIESCTDIENLCILATNKCLWRSNCDDHMHIRPILLHLFISWCDFNNTKRNDDIIRNIGFEALFELIKYYKEQNKCHDILSVLVIKWVLFHEGSTNNIKLVDEINFKCLSKSMRRHWMKSLHKMGESIMKHENEKIIELLTRKIPNVFKFDSVDLKTKTMFDFSEIDDVYILIPINDTFYNMEIRYFDNKFVVKLNDLNRYNLEGVEMNVDVDVKINVIANNYPHWLRITGALTSFPTVVSELTYVYDRVNFDNANEDDIIYQDANIVKIITDVLLKI